MVVNSLTDLRSRLAYLREGSSRGLAFCVGTGLTAPAVPGVDAAIDSMAEALQGEDERDLRIALGGSEGGAAYQQAASFLLARRGQGLVNQIVRDLVLRAHRPTHDARSEGRLEAADLDNDYCARAEADLERWEIPDAVVALAKLVVHHADFAPGPILTTNFDPLMEIAVRREGGTAVSLNLDTDGRIGDVEAVDGVVVVHLHGFWRLGDTLHAPIQLLQRREILQASLEELFDERTVLVCGYGGWDDAFTTALTEAVRRHRHGELDVLWTFYEADEAAVSHRYRKLAESLAFVPGRVSFYKGIECAALFEGLWELASEVRGALTDQKPAPADFSSPVEGFAAVSAAALQTHSFAEDAERLVPFFDGQVPTWFHALSPLVPRLNATLNVIELIQGDPSQSRLRVHLVQGPAGEGKSTLALQVAAHFGAETRSWRVLWREPGLESTPIDLLQLETGPWRWLLLVDDADTLAERLFDAVRVAHQGERSDLSVVAVARGSDWLASGAERWPWSEYVELVRHRVRGLSDADAEAVVKAWASAGEAGLRRLADEPDLAARARSLKDATVRESSDATLTGEGSFLGAMLRVRFGEGLRDHVRSLMERLAARESSSGINGLRAFLTVAAPHCHNILTLAPYVLAEALQLPMQRLFSEVIWPLGEEAAATRAGSAVITRHRAIAEAAVDLAATFGEDVAEIYYELIRATIRVRRAQVFVPDMAALLYLSSRLIDRDARVAVRAAQAPVDEEPNRITYRSNLVRMLRLAGRADEGLEVAATAHAERADMFDRRTAYRGLLFEWGVACGVTNRPGYNALLAAQSLADLSDADPVDARGANVGFRGLQVAFRALARQHRDANFEGASEAALNLERSAIGTGGVDHALEEVVEAAKRAATYAEKEPQPGGDFRPEAWSFEDLHRLFGRQT
jgi:hypothetical protein